MKRIKVGRPRFFIRVVNGWQNVMQKDSNRDTNIEHSRSSDTIVSPEFREISLSNSNVIAIKKDVESNMR